MGRELPADLSVSIANDLIKAPEYAGFPEAGQLLKTAITNPAAIGQINPSLSQPLKVILASNLVISHGASAEFLVEEDGKNINARVANRSTDQSFEVDIVEASNRKFQVLLEQTIVYGSNAVKALLIVKEVSHLVHIPALKQIIYDQFVAKFDLAVNSSLPVADLLFNNAVISTPIDSNPEMSFEYRNASVLVDWAGYWHITPALGRMLKQGVLTDMDKKVMSSNIDAFNLAQSRGLISEKKPGVFVWKQNVGSYSQEWQQIMRDTRGNIPILKDPRP